MGITELVELVRAGLDADELLAREATPGPWTPEEPFLADVVTSALLGRVADCSVGTGYRPQSLPDARHISRHDPAAVLRRVARDRVLLDLALGWEHGLVRWDHNVVRACDSVIGKPCDCGRDERVHAVLQTLATPYQETT